MIPEPTASAATRASKQRKNSHDEANSSAAVNQSEDESGNENRQKSARRRKRAHTGSENVKRKRAKASGSSRAGGSEHVEAVTLIQVLTVGRSAVQTVIDDWIEAYQKDRDTSLLDLISFFIQCSGCKGVVTAEMCQSGEDRELRSKMVEELDEVSGLQYKKFLAFPWILTVTWPLYSDNVEYPLIQSGPEGRWFSSEFCDFMSVLVSQCQHSVIFDSYLMNTLISLLTELSGSLIRAFRHTCTLAAVKLLSSLVAVAMSLSERKTRQRSNVQQERIEKKVTELQGKRAEIESMMDILFKGVFLKRYRDVLPQIRSLCMAELGLWMKLYSSAFLNDSYLKSMGWMMHDKIPDVRLKCVLGLQGLYVDPQLLPKLDLFTSRFKDRLISMTLDKDNEVAVQTMKLLLLISRTSVQFQLVYSSQRPLAAAAGELLFSRLVNTAGPTSDAEDDINKEGLHKHVVYLVDSLWDVGAALLKDWLTLTSILLQDPSSHAPGLTCAEQVVLVEMLVASVRQAAEGPSLAGRSGAKKVMNAKERKIQNDDCTKLTDHFLVVLPQLLSKSSESSDCVASLMKIPQFFLPECPDSDNTQAVSALTAEMETVLERHAGPSVLEAAARTSLSLCGGGGPQPGTPETLLTELLGGSLKGDSFSADEEKTGDILATLKKLRAFHNCHNLLRWNLFELLSPLLSVESSEGGAPPEVLLEVLQCLSSCMIRSLSTSTDSLTSRKAVAQRLQLRLFCERGHHCLSHSHPRVQQQLQVWDPSCFGPLLCTPSPKLQRALSTFLCMHVFPGPDCESQSGVLQSVGTLSEEERLEELHKRRNMLAAFCKLIVHRVLEMSMAAEVFIYYMKYFNEFGDIIKRRCAGPDGWIRERALALWCSACSR
ncbi:hypothetical protein KUCAC02_010646 [Chaenocephalus aceratus]|uniref:Uncharacterized protein n=1 Tax=Chaenocephalus aceratus TaxID=36190 RepID=A0ACB9W1A0_CHAAC|nr:hypothetical protein KUCAC02_010646 [Chaenocephalus aceratus]